MTTPSPVVSVPREPTEAMINAAQEAFPRSAAFVFPRLWAAMLAAVPPHEEGAAAWLSVDAYGNTATTHRTDTAADWKHYGRAITPLFAHPAQQSSDVSSLVEALEAIVMRAKNSSGNWYGDVAAQALAQAKRGGGS